MSDGKGTPPEIIERFKPYIEYVRWKKARSMPQWPHWYTIKEWNVVLEPEFEALVAAIDTHGYTKRFLGRDWKYLDIGIYCYWGDGWTDEITIINRAEKKGSEELWANEAKNGYRARKY